jgi:hypothetical protein
LLRNAAHGGSAGIFSIGNALMVISLVRDVLLLGQASQVVVMLPDGLLLSIRYAWAGRE